MSADDPLLASLLAAVAAAPTDVALRLHVASVLAERGRTTEAVQHCGQVLAADPTNTDAMAMLQRLTAAPQPEAAQRPDTVAGFDWEYAEKELAGTGVEELEKVDVTGAGGAPVIEDIERPTVRLADVGGMDEVKERLELAFLGPMRNPTLAKAFGKTLSGGLLLYGPPGCGKTFIARAVAGELGANFFEVGISDVLDMYVGQSERNLTKLFTEARRHAPCVLFLDEIDALGQKRSHLRNSSSMRNTVNQLLAEMDSAGKDNDGVFVLGATNHPWDMDSALRRPGRFDRMVLVLPPDAPARRAILAYHLRDRPVTDVDLDRLVKITEHYSGADLAHICNTAAEKALADSMHTGKLHPLTTKRLLDAVREVRPSTGPWFATARNVVTFGDDGDYADLAAYLRKHKKL